jgi:hypothetical protein
MHLEPWIKQEYAHTMNGGLFYLYRMTYTHFALT